MYIPVGKPDKRRKAASCLGLGRGDTCWAGRSSILGAVRTNRHKDPELSGLYSRVDFSRIWCLAVSPKKWTLFRGSERRELWIKKRAQRDLQGEKFIPKSSGA